MSVALTTHKLQRKRIIPAASLFVLQFVYYQFQAYLGNVILPFLPDAIPFLPVNHTENILHLLHILMHAAFSIVIVHILYRDKKGTMLVVWMSLILLGVYISTNILGKILDLFVINIISTKILFFISSPFKTIFSIPALKLRQQKEVS